MAKKQKKAPYYLLIHTNSYTGNFDRELIAYCIGRLDDIQKDHCPEFIKPFWNSVAGGGIDSERHILRDHGPSAHIAAHFGRAFPGKGVPGLDELKNWKSHAYFFRNPLILLL